MPDLKSLSVSIVTYHSELRVLKETLISLSEECGKLNAGSCCRLHTIYILDNDSSASYQNQLRALISELEPGFPDSNIEFKPQTQNRGFGAGHNIAIHSDNSDFILILNPDIVFLPGSLSKALELIVRDRPTSLCLPLVCATDGTDLHLHSYKPSPLDIFLRSIAPCSLKRLFNKRLSKLYEVPIDIPIAPGTEIVFSGCCMLFRREELVKAGAFDERFFLYFEDYELSLRFLRSNAAIITSGFKVKHYGGSSFKKSKKHIIFFIKSALKFYSISTRKKKQVEPL